jgi:hypothetical protein
MTTGTRYPSPYIQYFNANGTPMVGGKLYFYGTGTTTLSTTYNDYMLSIPNPNPIVLDSLGSPGNVFLANGAVYRVRLRDANNIIIFDMDNVVSFAPS